MSLVCETENIANRKPQMNEQTPKNPNGNQQFIKIKTGGCTFCVLVAVIIFFLYLDVMCFSSFIFSLKVSTFHDLIADNIASKGLFKTAETVLGCFIIVWAPISCLVLFKASIEVRENDVVIKSIRNCLGGFWPKLEKIIIPLSELNAVLQKTDWVDRLMPSKLYWEMKNDETLWTNAIYFSKKDLSKLFDELTRRGIDTQMR
jgi:hypothetical protein